MAWDFQIDPEFQQVLDWADEFVRTEVEPLDLVFGSPYDRSDEKAMAIAGPSSVGSTFSHCSTVRSAPATR